MNPITLIFFLEPFVDELLKFWQGVNMNTNGSSSKKMIRCALLCVACDLPAGQKLCGFLSYSASLGCSCCLKRFIGSVGSMDYSGFDRDSWQLRTGSEHRDVAFQLQNFHTRTARVRKESEKGCRFSVLLKLPYFDAPRMLIVDPMHNLFLGTAKYVLKDIWMEFGIITDKQFQLIQQRIDSCKVPSDIGRIPRKIESGFLSFTAEQWKNWVLYYSLLAMHDMVHGNHIDCWRHFVLACTHLCCKSLTTHDIKLASANFMSTILSSALLLQFCKRVERLYGTNKITPNMHMHCHLRACIEDYGPLHGFWLYAFEWYNGLLGSTPNNNRAIEVQLMHQFLSDNLLLLDTLSEDLPEEFTSLYQLHHSKLVGLVNITINDHTLNPEGGMSDDQDCEHQYKWAIILPGSDIRLPKRCSRYILQPFQAEIIHKMYFKLYKVPMEDVEMPMACFKYSSVKLSEIQFGSCKSLSSSSSIVIVKWDVELFGSPVFLQDLFLNRFVQDTIKFFLGQHI